MLPKGPPRFTVARIGRLGVSLTILACSLLTSCSQPGASQAAAESRANSVPPATGAAPATSVQYVLPFPVVGIPEDSDADVDTFAKLVAKRLEIAGSSIRAKVNPICCNWIEIRPEVPNPGWPGFIWIVQPGGSILIASDLKWARRGLDALVDKSIRKDNQLELPIGVLTSYPFVGTVHFDDTNYRFGP